MIIFAILADGYSEAVGFKDNKEVHWSMTTFARDLEIMKELGPKCKEFPPHAAPTLIKSLADMLSGTEIKFKVVRLELTDKEAFELSKKHNHLTLA